MITLPRRRDNERNVAVGGKREDEPGPGLWGFETCAEKMPSEKHAYECKLPESMCFSSEEIREIVD